MGRPWRDAVGEAARRGFSPRAPVGVPHSWRPPPPAPETRSARTFLKEPRAGGGVRALRGQDPQCTSLGKREERHPPEPPRGRTPTSSVHERTDSRGTHARTPTSQRVRAPEATAKGTPARGLSPLPRSPSPAKPVGPRQPPWGEVEGASSQLREPAPVCSPSPVKGSTKIPVQLPPARPPTPGRGCAGTVSGGPSTESSH